MRKVLEGPRPKRGGREWIEIKHNHVKYKYGSRVAWSLLPSQPGYWYLAKSRRSSARSSRKRGWTRGRTSQEQGARSQEQKAAGSAAATGKVCRANNVHFWHINIHIRLIYIYIYRYIYIPYTHMYHILTDCSLEWQIKQSLQPPTATPTPTPTATAILLQWICLCQLALQ